MLIIVANFQKSPGCRALVVPVHVVVLVVIVLVLIPVKITIVMERVPKELYRRLRRGEVNPYSESQLKDTPLIEIELPSQSDSGRGVIRSSHRRRKDVYPLFGTQSINKHVT